MSLLFEIWETKKYYVNLLHFCEKKRKEEKSVIDCKRKRHSLIHSDSICVLSIVFLEIQNAFRGIYRSKNFTKITHWMKKEKKILQKAFKVFSSTISSLKRFLAPPTSWRLYRLHPLLKKSVSFSHCSKYFFLEKFNLRSINVQIEFKRID